MSIVRLVSLLFFLLTILALDAAGFFIYFGYWPAWTGLVVIISVLLLSEHYDLRKPGTALTSILLCITSVLLVAACPYLRTSGRKGFYLDATSLKAGDSFAAVKEKMKDYQVFDRYKDAITYSFRSGEASVDHVVVRLSPDGMFVVSSEFSPD